MPAVTFLLLPRHKITLPKYHNSSPETPVHQPEILAVGDLPMKRGEDSVWRMVFSTVYLSFLTWFGCLHVRGNAFISFYNGWLTHLVNGDISKGKSKHRSIDIPLHHHFL